MAIFKVSFIGKIKDSHEEHKKIKLEFDSFIDEDSELNEYDVDYEVNSNFDIISKLSIDVVYK